MLFDTIHKLHHLSQHLLKSIHQISSPRKLGLWFGTISVSSMTACVYGPVQDCCQDDYIPEQQEGDSSLLLYKKMCYQTMTFDSDYDLAESCRLKKADQYIDAAKACCAPLASTVSSTGSIGSDYTYDMDNGYFQYNDARYKSIQPLNAYSWCLLNTHPRTYECNLAKATELDTKSKECCQEATDKTTCIADFMRSNGQTCNNIPENEKCCRHLPDTADDNNISRSECIEIYNNYGVCTNSKDVACCISLRDNSTEQYIDEDSCQMIHHESNGKHCVNTDALLEKYNSGELCCEDSPATANEMMYSKSECLENYRSTHECVPTKVDLCCSTLTDDLKLISCRHFFNESNGKECFNTEETLLKATQRSLCCIDVPETPMQSGLTNDICIELFDFNTNRCINTDDLYNDYKNNQP